MKGLGETLTESVSHDNNAAQSDTTPHPPSIKASL